MISQAAFDFIEGLDGHSDSSALFAAYQSLLMQFGMTGFSIADISHPKIERSDRLWGSTWPLQWIIHYENRKFLPFDPITTRQLMHPEPFRWSLMRGDDKRVAAMFDEAAEFGLHDGLAVPIHNLHGKIIGVSLSTDRYALGKSEESCLHLATLYFHARLERLRAAAAPAKIGTRLTSRERDCLSWVAAGKTDWEIGRILTIAEQTVHEHVRNALVKLNAATRAQAVAVALVTRQLVL